MSIPYRGHLLSMAAKKSHEKVRVHYFVRTSDDQQKEIARCGETVRVANLGIGPPRNRDWHECPRCAALILRDRTSKPKETP